MSFSFRDLKHVQWLSVDFNIVNVTHIQLINIIHFLWSSYHQHTCHKILASLRINNPNVSYQIPYGDWFEYVSCPHYLTEILVYLALAAILGSSHQTGIMILIWVGMNQLVAGITSHFWYQDKFENYPRDRKAVLPWIL